jgi:hypothetical protein
MNKNCFSNHPLVKLYIPEEIVRWANDIVWGNFLSTDKNSAKEKVEHKVSHILQVVETGREIMENENIDNKKQGLVICFLHDIGRFPQVKLDSYSDIKTGIDHGALGAKMVVEMDFDFNGEGLNKSEIVEAIMWHNKKEYKGQNVYAKLIRDADKTALFLILDYMEKMTESEGQMGNNIKEESLIKLENGECIDNASVESKSEKALNVASWLSDLNFEYSKVLANKYKIKENILTMLAKNKNSKIEIERVKKALEKLLPATV